MTLSTDDLAPLIKAGWALGADGKALTKRFKFKDFNAAFAWMTRVAMMAEKLDHHPDWSNAYNAVEVSLTTHSTGVLTMLDLRLAQAMERFADQI